MRRARRGARDRRARGAQGARAGDHDRARRGRGAAHDARRSRAAQDLRAQPGAERVRGMPEGGRLRLAARLDAGQLLLLVADTGVGLTPGRRGTRARALFLDEGGRRRAGPRARTAHRRGPRRNDRARSTPGRGTTVHVRLPIRAPAEALEPEAQGVRA